MASIIKSMCCGGEVASNSVSDDTIPVIEAPIPRSSVFVESMEMLTGSLLIYAFAELREMAREGELASSLSDLELPMTTEHMLDILKSNKDELEKRAVDHEELAQRLTSFENIKDHEGQLIDSLLGQGKKARLTHFVDENATKEMVHAIVVNDVRKRITVLFRGSVTQQDFLIDAKCHQKKVENPVAHLSEESTPTINLHTGFHQYLFMKKDESGKGRLERILEDVKLLLNENPGYRIYCTGHSLGGALSTLCGFYAAADDEIVEKSGGSITVVSIASPLVGNLKFRVAFQTLERLKRLQHLRIANKEDMVTLVPFVAPKVTALSPVLAAAVGGANLYKHCGMRLKLKSALKSTDAKLYSIVYSRDHSDDDAYAEEKKHALGAGKSLAGSLALVVKRDFQKLQCYHSCHEYEARLESCKKFLTQVTLDDLYSDKEIVGNTLDEDYKPTMKLSISERAAKVVKNRKKKKVEPEDEASAVEEDISIAGLSLEGESLSVSM